MTIRFRCLYQPGLALLPQELAQPGQEARPQVWSLWRRWQAQEDKGSRWLNEQVFQLVSMQQHVVLSIAHQDHAVTAQVMHERRNTLKHIPGKNFMVFYQDLAPGDFPLDGLQEVIRLLDVFQARSP